MQQYTADHFGGLRELLSSACQNGIQQQKATSSMVDNSSQSFWPGFSVQQSRRETRVPANGRPPRAAMQPAAGGALCPPAALQVPMAQAPMPHARDAAGWDAVHKYLAQRQPVSQPEAAAPQALPFLSVPVAPAIDPYERRSKRGKPCARRSLQKLFDAAAEDSSTRPSGSCAETEDDSDNGWASATSSQTDCAFPRSYGTPTAVAAAELTPETPSSAPVRPTAQPSAPQVPLVHLLSSDRGRRLSTLEAKAIFLRVAEDLAALHDASAVHRRVTLADVTLSLSGEFAAASLLPSKSTARVNATRCEWAPREQGTEGYAAPEAARCPADRAVHTPASDSWSLGVLLFALLSGGNLPFGDEGLCSGECAHALLQSIDSLQSWLQDQMKSKIEFINTLSEAQARAGDVLEMRVLGIDAAAASLLLGLLHADPAQRLSPADVLEHRWMEEVAPMVPRLRCHENGIQAALAPPAATGPALSDVTRRTEKLAFSNSAEGKAVHQNCAGGPGGPAASTGCPYPIIGHVAQPLEVCMDGVMVIVSALHAVYAVPGHGAMMSATPVAVGPHIAAPGAAAPLGAPLGALAPGTAPHGVDRGHGMEHSRVPSSGGAHHHHGGSAARPLYMPLAEAPPLH